MQVSGPFVYRKKTPGLRSRNASDFRKYAGMEIMIMSVAMIPVNFLIIYKIFIKLPANH